MHFHTKEEKKSLEKKIKWKKIQSITPATHFFWLWAKPYPYLPLPPFSSKSKNIQLRNTTRKRDEAEAWKKTKNETCIKQPAAQHPRMRFQRSYQKHITCTHWIKNDDFSHEKLWKHKPDINVEISSSLTCRLLRRTILSFLLQLCYKNKISWNKGYLTNRY